MKALLKLGLLALCAVAATMSLLGLILCGIFKMEVNSIVENLNSETVLYIFPSFILFEFYLFANDMLVHLSKKHQLNFGLEFSEVRLTFDLDNNNAPIPLRVKLLQLYPLSIGLTLFGFVLVLLNR
jgi:hypothetical protein